MSTKFIVSNVAFSNLIHKLNQTVAFDPFDEVWIVIKNNSLHFSSNASERINVECKQDFSFYIYPHKLKRLYQVLCSFEHQPIVLQWDEANRYINFQTGVI